MKDLIERLEAATGPDRRLDAEIACALKFPDLRPAEPDDHKEHLNGVLPGAGHIWCPTGFLMADSYTRSIDAALTLVPDGWSWKLLHEPKYTRVYRVVVRGASTLAEVAPAYVISSPTPALALCIAALRARCSVSSPDAEAGR